MPYLVPFITALLGLLSPQEPVPQSASPDRLAHRLAGWDLDRQPWSSETGWLTGLLEVLEIPPSAQTLVFSQTSFQNTRISSHQPRALFFGDDVYLGWIPGAPVVEVITLGEAEGPGFFTIDQSNTKRPRLTVHGEDCLTCHGGPLTHNRPGLLARSVHPAADGIPILGFGSNLVDHTTPLAKRWGGWFVTGDTGGQPHLGNRTTTDEEGPLVAAEHSAPEFLASRLKRLHYPSEGSDLLALMVLEHQLDLHNRMTEARLEVASALERDRVLAPLLGESADRRSSSSIEILEHQAERLLDGLLFHREAPLKGPIQGSSSFASDFGRNATRDSAGRSLRDFDLSTRLMRYPCSWLILDPSWDTLPPEVGDLVRTKLHAVLTGAPAFDRFVRLSLARRGEILELLGVLKPSYFKGF